MRRTHRGDSSRRRLHHSSKINGIRNTGKSVNSSRVEHYDKHSRRLQSMYSGAFPATCERSERGVWPRVVYETTFRGGPFDDDDSRSSRAGLARVQNVGPSSTSARFPRFLTLGVSIRPDMEGARSRSSCTRETLGPFELSWDTQASTGRESRGVVGRARARRRGNQ